MENYRDKWRLWVLNFSRGDLGKGCPSFTQSEIALIRRWLEICFGPFPICSYLECRSVNTVPSTFSKFQNWVPVTSVFILLSPLIYAFWQNAFAVVLAHLRWTLSRTLVWKGLFHFHCWPYFSGSATNLRERGQMIRQLRGIVEFFIIRPMAPWTWGTSLEPTCFHLRMSPKYTRDFLFKYLVFLCVYPAHPPAL